MDKELFDDLVSALHEAIEYEKGNVQLKTTTIEIPDEEIKKSTLFHSFNIQSIFTKG